MSVSQEAFRGSVDASAIIVDARLLGVAEARRRAARSWQPGSTIKELPDGTWLLTLPRAVRIRAEQGPGLVLVAKDGSLGPTGAGDSPRGTVRVPIAGRLVDYSAAALPDLSLADWFRLPDAVVRLSPLEVPPPAVERPAERRPVPVPDVRQAANVKRPRGRAERRAREIAAKSRTRDTLSARLLLRTPAGRTIGRRQERFLRDLTQSFKQRKWDDALRDAIALGEVGGALRLRRARRLGPLVPHPLVMAGGGLPLGGSVQQQLAALYRQAAKELERAGEIIEAAFVYSDLLASPLEAILVLERGKQWQLAAELAEGRQLAPELVVRLWWQAGNRTRALGVARARGAFATAVERLSTTDVESARRLRREWAQSLSTAGDHLAAVQALWPDSELRPEAMRDISLGLALGGATAAELNAYLIALTPVEPAVNAARALLNSRDDGRHAAQDAFFSGLARVTGIDPPVDRELTSLALRTILIRHSSDAPHGPWSQASFRQSWKSLQKRADPLLVADLPRMNWAKGTQDAASIAFSEGTGQLQVFDAAFVAGGLLVACGEAGTDFSPPTDAPALAGMYRRSARHRRQRRNSAPGRAPGTHRRDPSSSPGKSPDSALVHPCRPAPAAQLRRINRRLARR